MNKKIIALLTVLLFCLTFTVNAFAYSSGGSDFDLTQVTIISLVFGIIVALCVTGFLKGQLKTVRRQRAAQSYERPDSFKVLSSTDLYLYRRVTRVKIEKNNK